MLISVVVVGLVVKVRVRVLARLSRWVGAGFHGPGLVFRVGDKGFGGRGQVGGGRAKAVWKQACSWCAQGQV
jgi:hypothetical protein